MYKYPLIISIILISGFQTVSAQDTQTHKDSILNATDRMNGDAIKMRDRNRDSAINSEYRKTRDAMNNKGLKTDTGMHSTFKMKSDDVNPDSAINHVPKVNGDLNMNRVPVTNRDSLMNRVPRMYNNETKRSVKKKIMKNGAMNDTGMNEDTDSIPKNWVKKRNTHKNRMTDNAKNTSTKMDGLNNSHLTDINSHDGLTMRNGKMMEMKNGTLIPMNYNITLVNGTHVSQDGLITKKNGVKVMMKEGDFIDFYGSMIR